jgi:hypothetical protein
MLYKLHNCASEHGIHLAVRTGKRQKEEKLSEAPNHFLHLPYTGKLDYEQILTKLSDDTGFNLFQDDLFLLAKIPHFHIS